MWPLKLLPENELGRDYHILYRWGSEPKSLVDSWADEGQEDSEPRILFAKSGAISAILQAF